MKTRKKKIKRSLYITMLLEIECYAVALVLLINFNQTLQGNGKIVNYYNLFAGLVLFVAGLLIQIAELIYKRNCKYYLLKRTGSRYIFDLKHFSDDKTLSKSQKYISYSIREDNIEKIKDYKLFKIVYGSVSKRKMKGNEIVSSTLKDKFYIPYFLEEGMFPDSFVKKINARNA